MITLLTTTTERQNATKIRLALNLIHDPASRDSACVFLQKSGLQTAPEKLVSLDVKIDNGLWLTSFLYRDHRGQMGLVQRTDLGVWFIASPQIASPIVRHLTDPE